MPSIKSTKVLQKRSDQAVESFHRYYASIWTEERWHGTLFPALSSQIRYAALLNLYTDRDKTLTAVRGGGGTDSPSEELIDLRLPCIQLNDGQQGIVLPEIKQKSSSTPFPPPSRIEMQEPGGSKGLSHWNMDAASILAACMLQVRAGESVLDLCAAPGGKSLVLAQMLWPSLHLSTSSEVSKEHRQVSGSFLQSNEFDHTRNKRLAANLQAYLPAQVFDAKAVRITSSDGTLKSAVGDLVLGEGGYDKVLVDAPCSSERHIIHTHLKASSSGQIAEEMMNWKPSHPKSLAKTQVSLLMTAFKALKIGGIVVYATCSISNEENDEVIERVLEMVKKERKRNPDSVKYAWKIKLDTRFEQDPNAQATLDSLTEKTKYGRIALPDHISGGKWGPLYFCTFQKVASQPNKGTRPIGEEDLAN